MFSKMRAAMRYAGYRESDINRSTFSLVFWLGVNLAYAALILFYRNK